MHKNGATISTKVDAKEHFYIYVIYVFGRDCRNVERTKKRERERESDIVCVCEKERESAEKGQRKRVKEREIYKGRDCVCVFERERERMRKKVYRKRWNKRERGKIYCFLSHSR